MICQTVSIRMTHSMFTIYYSVYNIGEWKKELDDNKKTGQQLLLFLLTSHGDSIYYRIQALLALLELSILLESCLGVE